LYNNYYGFKGLSLKHGGLYIMAKWIFLFALLTIALMLIIMWQAGIFSFISDAVSAIDVLTPSTTSTAVNAIAEGTIVR